ncbi:hypothetical protein GCM10022200_01350 [Microbacterium awajiense]|uniref:Uncharacterized protein n=1 Tax=Microbacterium awajiense TaxID=415214 RepID=A0ABP6ZZD2_9MICO
MHAPFDPVDADKPLADVIEQRESAGPGPTEQTPDRGHPLSHEANEADVAEQDLEVPLDDEDYRDAD